MTNVKCHQSPVMFWTCPKLYHFWEHFFATISAVLHINVPPSPQIAIFGTPAADLRITAKQAGAIAFCSLIARRQVLFHWKGSQPMLFLKLEKNQILN